MSSLKWTPLKPEWTEESYNLLLDYPVEKIPTQTIGDILENSASFPIKFSAEPVRCCFLKKMVPHEILERNINSVYPFVHHKALELFCKFILFKRKYGSPVEKRMYESMSLKQFIERLLMKRAVCFFGANDKYMLNNGKTGSGGWETIGKTGEKAPLILQDCLSYDEIKCSVFLNASSYTYFVNRGDRKNMAKFSEDRSDIEDEGIIVGMIGTRLKKPHVMEYEELVITENQNAPKNGFGSNIPNSLHTLFSTFYEEKCLDYNETVKLKVSLPSDDINRFVNLKEGLFDNYLYYKRLALSFDSLLQEANYRAKCANKMAYIHVVGLGLGVWRVSPHQGKVFMDTFADRIELLGNHLHSVSDICFSYITPLKCGNFKHGNLFGIRNHPLGGVKIHMFKREPHLKVGDGKLLVVSYAWDGNALPGNEWWLGKLGSSGDSAAASSTQITELHNPHINPLVSANNLMVITENNVVPLEKYQEIVRCAKAKRQKEDFK